MNLRLLGIGCLLLLGSALSSCAGRTGPPARPGARQLPGLGLGVHDHIESVDFAVAGDSVLHLVWRVRFGDEGGLFEKRQIWYRRGDLKNKLWSSPHLLVDGTWRGYDVPGTHFTSSGRPVRTGEPRILSLGSGIHVIVSDSLRHFFSGDEGATWKEESPLLPQHFGVAQSIDVASDSVSLYVAYIARRYPRAVPPLGMEPPHRGESDLSEAPQSVWVTRWTEGEKPSTTWVQSIGEKTPWSPLKLRLGGEGMDLFCTANELERFTKTDFRMTGWLFHSSSRDKAKTWTNRDSSGYDDGIFEFDVAVTGTERSVFQAGHPRLSGLPGLHCARWQGGAWSSSYGVAKAKDAPFCNYNRVTSINAATHGDKGQLVWIDTRYQRAESPLLNPLAWLPWVGEPGWGNNDVLAVPFSEVIRGSAVARTLQPMRLTKDLSYAEFVRARAEKDRVYVVWSGRSKVGKDITSANQPPEIFYTILPRE